MTEVKIQLYFSRESGLINYSPSPPRPFQSPARAAITSNIRRGVSPERGGPRAGDSADPFRQIADDRRD
ncbi:hypothetical protein EVAR_101986_1 [Eumeta japonica]|uniref:Uncharacterized protein n=1 Tax=Eumeta variegata TaxID=151549 RepID=A0A4C1TSL7_EUMVA|nr:hypothetical protein EVAR_101986_1 [Eumeta japonica]